VIKDNARQRNLYWVLCFGERDMDTAAHKIKLWTISAAVSAMAVGLIVVLEAQRTGMV
jgi:hypothetical protein